ncbi:MAG TPA: alpha/beta hydrolase [Geminicoccaceae bacterium]|nr:alpha/beta hydrolase [Geminicoccus sp.]HMU48836.1 alpha/beta hydrolase [Geminicoccaceae bacterium]
MRRLATLVLALVLLGGCAAVPAPPVDDTDAGRPSAVWRPEGTPRAVLLALHGFNDHHTAFAEFGPWAAGQGVLVEAYDQRGFGANPDHGRWPGAEALTADLRAAVVRLRQQHPGVPLYVLGESMGAAVITVAMTGSDAPEVDGIVLSAPAVWGGAALNPFYRATLWVMRNVVPSMTLTGRGLGKQASDNIPMLRALGADPLFIKETRVDAIGGVVDLMGEALQRGPALTTRKLVLIGQRDEIVPPEAQETFVASLPASGCTLVSYPEGWHLLLRDLQRQRVWQDILGWIGNGTPPSGLATACPAADLGS